MKVDGIPQRSSTVPTDKTFTFYYRTFGGIYLVEWNLKFIDYGWMLKGKKSTFTGIKTCFAFLICIWFKVVGFPSAHLSFCILINTSCLAGGF